MKEIKQAIKNHLRMDTQGALLISGAWGSGKTYYLKQKLFPNLIEETGYTPVIISLYGENDIKNITKKIFQGILAKKGDKILRTDSWLSSALSNGKKILKSIKIINKYVDTEELLEMVMGNVFDLIHTHNIALFLDDMERLGEGINTNDFLGYVNELSENKGGKVILVANSKEMDVLKYREKTISKTIQYTPDLLSLFDDVIEEFKDDQPFFSYLSSNKKFILRTLDSSFDPNFQSISDMYSKRLKEDFSNLRFLNSALEHFKDIYTIFSNKRNITEKVFDTQLKNLWCFILGIIIENRSSHGMQLTKEDRKGLDIMGSQWLSIENIELFTGNIDSIVNQEDTPEKDDRTKFIEKYFSRISQRFFFFEEVYKFICSGSDINEQEFFIDLDNKFRIVNDTLSPAYDLLNEFMSVKQSQFSDKEFPEKLQQLQNYIEKGDYNKYIDYINVSVYLFGYKDYFENPKSNDDIRKSLEQGVRIFRDRSSFDLSEKFDIERMTEGQKDPNVIQYKNFILKLLKEKVEATHKDEASVLEKLFIKSPNDFYQAIYNNGSIIFSRNTPIFHLFDFEQVTLGITNWQAEDYLVLSSLMNKKYLKGLNLRDFEEEFPFMLELINHFEAKDTSQKVLSMYYLETQLKPILVKVRQRIEQWDNAGDDFKRIVTI
ncbi:hypothetical protein [Aquimarina algiphila]|uniref:KAP NTPase domain-containing protein n=1 Tax=Aquimarina algiphila TaxID=2047982 RepID=A0A554VJ53_9FLAO|nr:hypothetical protein [Aquimarina algiphila]TSE07923.1 hypothetical protein FOF46_14455 [Aquimarina algiphila]